MCTIIPDQHLPADKTLGAAAELNAKCIAAAAVLGDYKAELASAPLASPPGREWMLRLASVLEDLLAALSDPADDEDDDGLEPYCAECGHWIGIFRGHGDGWHHWRGEGTVASPVELYDAGHQAAPAWCKPPGRFISPADAVTIRRALAEAQGARRDRAGGRRVDCEGNPAGACQVHLDDLDQADAFRDLAAELDAAGSSGEEL